MRNVTLQLRGGALDALTAWRADAPPSGIDDVFIPAHHKKALSLETMVVRGMRGAGKSFWAEALVNEKIRTGLADALPGLGWKNLADCKSIQWDSRVEQKLPSKQVLSRWLNKDGIEPLNIWAVLVLSQFPTPKGMEFPKGSDFDPWTTRIQWGNDNPDALLIALQKISETYHAKGQEVLVVFDGLDLVASAFGDSRKLLRGLFQFLLHFRRSKGLRFKAFVREDMTTREVSDFSDASKLLNEAVDLVWSREDLYALLWHYIGQRNEHFRDWSSEIIGTPWVDKGGKWSNSSLSDVSCIRLLLEEFAGTYMGSDKRKGYVFTWWYDHLADGRNRVSPRTLFRAMTYALSETTDRFSEFSDRVLHPEAIRSGVRKASHDRVQELNEDYPWVETALAVIRNTTVPMEWIKLLDYWRNTKNRTIPTIEEKSRLESWFIPWDADDKRPSKKELELRGTLIEIGVLQLRDGPTQRVDLPDIYRLGYDVGRRGGIRRQS